MANKKIRWGCFATHKSMLIFLIKVLNVLVRHLAWGWQPFVFTEFKARFGGCCFASYILYIFTLYMFSLHTASSCCGGSDSESTRKYGIHEAPRSTRKLLVATQRQCWWYAYNEATHRQLVQLVTVTHERSGGKWRFVKSIRHLKWSDKKIRWKST